jgi:hypothetical protein
MPGKGKIKMRTRACGADEEPPNPLLGLLGKSTQDICLNDTAYWRNVPEKVWDFTIGGYQVMKKWLSYREHDLLGRPLTLTKPARSRTWPAASPHCCCSPPPWTRTTPPPKQARHLY